MRFLDPEHMLLDQTSLIEEQVVAALLGWMQEATRQPYLDLIKEGFSGESKQVGGPSFKELLRDLQVAAARVLSAAEEKGDAELIKQRKETVRKVDELVKQAQSYALAIKKELAKKKSVLKIAEDGTDDWSGEKALTIQSVNRWTRQQYKLCLIPDWDLLPMDEPWVEERESNDKSDNEAPIKSSTLITLAFLVEKFTEGKPKYLNTEDEALKYDPLAAYIEDIAQQAVGGKFWGQGRRTISNLLKKAMVEKETKVSEMKDEYERQAALHLKKAKSSLP